MRLDKAVQTIDSHLILWSTGKEKLVVAIDGYTGVGKTTLVSELTKINSNILHVSCDDFILPSAEFQNILASQTDRSVAFELYRNDYTKIEQLVNTFRTSSASLSLATSNPLTGAIDITKIFDCSKQIMLIEGVFMFHPKLLNNLWDKRIYLDGNKDIIDKRRVEREKKRWGDKYFPETHPDSFFRQVIIALNRYEEEYQPKKHADLVIRMG